MKDYQYIYIALLISTFVFAWGCLNAWELIENRKINVEESRVINESNRILHEICGQRGGTYKLGNIDCKESK